MSTDLSGVVCLYSETALVTWMLGTDSVRQHDADAALEKQSAHCACTNQVQGM